MVGVSKRFDFKFKFLVAVELRDAVLQVHLMVKETDLKLHVHVHVHVQSDHLLNKYISFLHVQTVSCPDDTEGNVFS